MSSSREKILTRLKQAEEKRNIGKLEQPNMDAPIYLNTDKNLADWFQENLELVSGQVFRANNLDGAIKQIKELAEQEKWDRIFCLDPVIQQALKGHIDCQFQEEDFENTQVGITSCEFLVSHLGSALVSSAGISGRRLHVYPETHIIIAHKGQLVKYLDDALAQIQEKYQDNFPSMITNITGPSRTADIEKTLVMGMHGPRNLFVLLCDEIF